jgi:hypothetical protein
MDLHEISRKNLTRGGVVEQNPSPIHGASRVLLEISGVRIARQDHFPVRCLQFILTALLL